MASRNQRQSQDDKRFSARARKILASIRENQATLLAAQLRARKAQAELERTKAKVEARLERLRVSALLNDEEGQS